jgi:hypothetical protein
LASRTPSASGKPSGGSAGDGGVAGKSSWISPSSCVAVSTPLRVAKRISLPAGHAPSCQSAWALARVACPHSATSARGVNQRSGSSPGPSRVSTKAVSERFISAATACIQWSSTSRSSRQTAAGLPANGRSVKASTWSSLTRSP